MLQILNGYFKKHTFVAITYVSGVYIGRLPQLSYSVK